MRLWPVVIDSRPAYLSSVPDTSLLLTPLGTDVVATRVREWVESVTRNAPVILSGDVTSQTYVADILAVWPSAQVLHSPTECIDTVGAYEPSDALLIVDPSALPVGGINLQKLIDDFAAEPRVAYYAVFLERGSVGTKERLNIDAGGRIRGILRHYEPTTWPFISGVAAAILPAATGAFTGRALPGSLSDLRRELTAQGVPSRDLPLETTILDLGTEQGLLAANLEYLRSIATTESRTPVCEVPVRVGTGHLVDPTARVVGPVVLQAGACIGPNVTLVGPVLVGRNARIDDNAVVAGAVIGAGCCVAQGTVVRGRAWFGVSSSTQVSAHVTPFLNPMPSSARQSHSLNRRTVDSDARRSLVLKRALDVFLSSVALVLLSPILLIAAILVRLDSAGPIFYGDKREGRSGLVFRCWKFRTMSVNADAVQKDLKSLTPIDGPHFKLDRDPRVTRIGRILRSTNVDELPQLFNVLRGEMSLVGPRPSPFRENQVCVPWREARLSVPPGITGMWQVCRHDRAAGDFHQWIEYDILYVRNLCLWLDFKILAATVFTVGGKVGHVNAEWLVPRAFGPDAPYYSTVSGQLVEEIEREKTA